MKIDTTEVTTTMTTPSRTRMILATVCRSCAVDAFLTVSTVGTTSGYMGLVDRPNELAIMAVEQSTVTTQDNFTMLQHFGG